MATQSPPPDAPAPEPAPPQSAPAAPSTAGVYEYVDLTPKTYLFPDGPQTAEKGDVCDLPYDPGDRCWQSTKKKVTRLRDNDPEQAAKTAAQQSAERARVLAQAAEREAKEAADREAAANGTGA
jgi:hypothetical protein